MKYGWVFILWICITELSAQTIHVVNEHRQPLPFASISLAYGDDSTSLQTDRYGAVSVPGGFRKDSVMIRISYIGYFSYAAWTNLAIDHRIQLMASPFQLDQVVVTAQYQPMRSDQVVHQMKVINREQIDAMGAINVRDVLRYQVNVRLGQDNILGSSVGLQGLSGQNVKILIDGVPVIGRLNGNIDVSQINLNTIERIEVVEGPMAVNYGTDALAGTINLITRKKETPGLSGALNTYYESVGQYNIDGRFSFRRGNHQWRLTAGRNYFDGWRSDHAFWGYPKRTLADASRVLNWDPKLQYFGRIDYRYQWQKGFIAPYFEYFDEDITNRGMPRAPYGIIAFDDTYHTQRSNGGGQWHQQLGKNHSLQMIIAHNRFLRVKNTWQTDLTTLERTRTRDHEDQDTARFQVWMSRGQWRLIADSSRLSYELGYEVNVEQAIGRRIKNKVQWQSDIALFATAEWRLRRNLTLRPGIRYTYNSTYDAPLIPSFHLIWRINAFTFRASYAQGFRAPTLKELYFQFQDINHNIIGNDNLKAENAHNFQGQLAWKKITSNSGYQCKVSAFFNHINDLITLAQIGEGDVYTYTNIGLFRSVGAQLSFEWQRNKWEATGQAAYIGQYHPQVAGKVGNPYTFAPQASVQLQYSIGKELQLAGFWKYNGAVPGFALSNNGEIVTTLIEDFHMLDLTMTAKFWDNRLHWQIGGKNLFDVQNIQIAGQAGGVHAGGSSVSMNWGRSLFTKVSWQW